MLLTLIRREIWKNKTALILQIAGLTVSLAAIGAAERLDSLANSSSIPGANCAQEAFIAVGKNDDGSFQHQWTSQQSKSLSQALGKGESALTYVMGVGLQTKSGITEANVAIVSDGYFKLLCVEDASSDESMQAFSSGAVITDTLAADIDDQQQLRIEATALSIINKTKIFRGTSKQQPIQVWVPQSAGRALGMDADDVTENIIHVWAKPGRNRTQRQLLHDLNKTVSDHPEIFGRIQVIVPIHNVELGAGKIESLKQTAILLWVFAIGLLSLSLINLAIYHGGRLLQTQAMAHLLAALGVPTRALNTLASIEPLMVAIVSVAISIPLSQALASGAASAISDFQAVSVPTQFSGTFLLLAVVVVTMAAVIMRARVYRRLATPSKGRMQRKLIRVLPWLLALQTCLAIILIAPAAQAAFGVLKNTPQYPAEQWDGLTISLVETPKRANKIGNVQLQWEAAMETEGDASMQSALATSGLPFEEMGLETATLDRAGSRVGVIANRVTANFFDVLKMPLEDNRSMPAYSSSEGKEGNSHFIVLNQATVNKLFAGQPYLDQPVGKERDTSYIVAGAVKGGSAGLGGERYIAYLPLASLEGATAFVVLTRHGKQMTTNQVSRKLEPVVGRFMPGARIVSSYSGKEAFANAMRRERAIAKVLSILAFAAIVTGALGIMAVVALMLRMQRINMAVSYSVGATRGVCIAQLKKRMLPPVLIGAGVAAIPALMAIYVIQKMVGKTSSPIDLGQPAVETLSGYSGAITTILLLVIAIIIMTYYIKQALGKAKFIDWLRYE